MSVWLWVEDPAATELKLDKVDTPDKATPLELGQIREAEHGAEQQFPQYSWSRVSASHPNTFLLRGDRPTD